MITFINSRNVSRISITCYMLRIQVKLDKNTVLDELTLSLGRKKYKQIYVVLSDNK